MEKRYWILLQVISATVVPFYGFLFYIYSKLPPNYARAVTNCHQPEEKKKNLDPCNMRSGPLYNKAHVLQLL